MKTCSIKESEGIEPQQLANLLDFIPVFEDPSFCPAGQIPVDEDNWPDEDFMKLVSRFMDACYKNGFVVRFDWENWEAEAMTYVRDPALLKEADLVILRRLFTWHIRQNRFTKNHVATMIASGHILLVLKSLGAFRV
ncbi:MAG: DUF6508 domain-containing protein [bacterium]|jgi:hypothetical protein